MSEQQQNQVYNIIAFIFADKDRALKVSKELKTSAKSEGYKIIANAVVEVDAKGKPHVHEAGHGRIGAGVGVMGGGMLAMIGGPVGLLFWAVAGGAIGGVMGQHMGRAIPTEDMKKLAEKMQPNTSAILAMVEDKQAEAMIDDMKGYQAQIVTLTVGDEASGAVAVAVAADVETPAEPAAAEPEAAASTAEQDAKK